MAALIEEVRGISDVRLGLLHGGNIEEHEGLPQMMIGAEPADRTGRYADNRTRLAAPDALSVGPRPHVDRVLEHGGQGTVVFRCDKQEAVE